MNTFSELSFTSSNGKYDIKCLKCVPEGDIKGVIQISHGIAEHIDRYREFMSFMADNGFVVVGDDHQGHGKSVADMPAEKGKFCENDGWNSVVSDMAKLHDMMCEAYPDKKYVMFGHSMGSFLTRTYLIDYPDKYDLAIISGTAHQTKLMSTAASFLANMQVKSNGYSSSGDKLSKLAFGSYNNKIDNPRTEYDWLTRDEAVVDKYMADDMCGFVCATGLYRDMITGIGYIINPDNIDKMNKDKAVYFMSGKEDPVGEYGKGVERAYKAFCNAGLKDVMIRLYDGGRHEMLNEINKADVMNDILKWINERI